MILIRFIGLIFCYFYGHTLVEKHFRLDIAWTWIYNHFANFRSIRHQAEKTVHRGAHDPALRHKQLFARVEFMLDPKLRRHPVAVGGDVENRHGIILAKNYESKKFWYSNW